MGLNMPQTLEELKQHISAVIDALMAGELTEDEAVNLAAKLIVRAREQGLFHNKAAATTGNVAV